MENKNRVFLNPQGWIEMVLVGPQTGETFRQSYEQVLPLLVQLKNEGKLAMGLVDGTEQTGYSLGSDRAALEYLENTQYDRIAMYHIPHAEVTKGIILAIGKSDTTKLFDSRAEAVAWLMRDPNAV